MEINPELKRYITQKKWKWKWASGGNLAIKTCPFCGRSKSKFWIHAERTIYRCWNCDQRGNLYKLKRELGDTAKVVSAARLVSGEDPQKGGDPVPMEYVDKWHRALLKNERALEYCDSRGFDDRTIRHFKLGLQRKHGVSWLAIPHINDGECANVKFRSLPPAEKAFRRVKGRASVLFNQDALADYDSIVIAESETDTMAFWQAGVRNVVGLTCGAETFLPEWFDILADKEKVTLALDVDAVGQHGARDIARRLGFDRCYNVLLPAHDANEVLQTLGPAELSKSLGQAEQFDVAGVVSLADAFLRCGEMVEMGEEGLDTPWTAVNRFVSWQPGDLIILSARTGVGKTSWALNVALHLAMQGHPVLFYCLEMSVERLAAKLAAVIRKKSTEDLGRVDFAYARYICRRLPFYFVDPDWGGSLKVDHVLDKIREVVKRHGIKYLVFDHLHFLCRSLQYLTNEIGQITRTFKLLTQELGLRTTLIAQPKKIGSDRVLVLDDLKDSASIPMDADQVIFIHRAAVPAALDEGDVSDISDNEVLEPKALMRFSKSRFKPSGDCLLWFDGAASTFYSWDERPVRDM